MAPKKNGPKSAPKAGAVAEIETQEVTAPVAEETALAVVDDGLTEEIVAAAPTPSVVSYAGGYGQAHKGHAATLKPEDVIIPMLKIVQTSSKILKAYKGRENECPFKVGDIYDSTTNRTWPGETGVLVVPISISDCVIERKPSPDGSFLAKLKTKDPRVQLAFAANGSTWKQLRDERTKTQFGYTDEVLVALLDPRDGETAISAAMVPFGGTNVFPRRLWWNAMAAVPFANDTPLYAFRTLLRTKYRPPATPGGLDSYMFDIQPYVADDWSNSRLPPTDPPHPSLERCLQLHNLYNSGALGKTDYSDADDSEEAREAAAFSKKDEPAF